MRKKIALWDRMEAALGDPDDLVSALAAVNSALRRKLQPISYGDLLILVRRHGLRIGVAQGLGPFIDFLCFVELAQGRPSPACMFVEKATGLPGTRLRYLHREQVERRQAEFITYWRRRAKAQH